MSDDIERQLGRINTLDERIVSVLNERANLARDIGSLSAGIGIKAAQEEADILEHVSRCGLGPLDAVALSRNTLKSCLPVAPWRND